MIKRIVKMSFKPENIEEFKIIFKNNCKYIKDFKGCQHVELLQDKNNPSIFFTYSLWDNEESVDNYRNSDLFKLVWSSTKILFNDKPHAWSVEVIF